MFTICMKPKAPHTPSAFSKTSNIYLCKMCVFFTSLTAQKFNARCNYAVARGLGRCQIIRWRNSVLGEEQQHSCSMSKIVVPVGHISDSLVWISKIPFTYTFDVHWLWIFWYLQDERSFFDVAFHRHLVNCCWKRT